MLPQRRRCLPAVPSVPRAGTALAAAALGLAACVGDGPTDASGAPAAAAPPAVSALSASLRGAPDASPHAAEARAAYREGDWERAEDAAKLALQADPRAADAHFLLGCLLARRGEVDQAIVAFQLSAALAPANPEALYNLGTLLLRRGEPLGACRLLEECVTLRSSDVAAWNNLAKAYFATGLPELSITAWEQALRNAPDDAIALSNLLLLAEAEGLSEAAAEYRRRLQAPRPRGEAGAPDTGPVWPVAAAPAGAGPPAQPGLDAAPAAVTDAEAEALRALLSDLSHVTIERRGGQLVAGGWTSGAREREVLVRVLAGRPEVLDLTSDDSGDPQRMIEVDAVLFQLSDLDQHSAGFNFLKLIDVSFNFFSSDHLETGTGYAAPPDVTGAVSSLAQEGWIFTASAAYSVNIANAATDRVAVLAQPHLTALSGTPATFLAGGELVYQVSGLNSGDIRPYPFGTTLTVTPTLLRTTTEDGMPRVHVRVEAGRTSVLSLLDADADQPTAFQKVNVSSEAVLELGQTLILSGLSQRESRSGRSGVPVLKDIPLLKYLFSTESTIQSDSAVIILLTPRDAAFRDERNERTVGEFIERRRAFLLARRGTPEDWRRYTEEHPDWARLPPNRFATHMFLLQNSEIYRAASAQQFTEADLALELLGPEPGG